MLKTTSKRLRTTLAVLCLGLSAAAQDRPAAIAGANEKTPSVSEYFTWINNTNEGATAGQTMANLKFFRWLNDRYGMRTDIYAFDAGAVDGAGIYGSTDSPRFHRQFPEGFGPIAGYAARQGTRLGLWAGPDGFGDTEGEALRRIGMMAGLVKDYRFGLFKMDGVCGQLRKDKVKYFDRMMTEIRSVDPGFILLNHRLQLYDAVRHSTTFLLGGEETYIDVHQTNDVTAPHHRAKALARKGTPGLTRLTEDHGVCLSSCLDYWDDDLVLQAFNRNLIVSPQIYGNPWLLRDDEYSYLAFLFNLHRDYRDILVNGLSLPCEDYGPEAVSRGDGATRMITLRNLGWEPVRYKVRLDGSIGLEATSSQVKVRLYHPYIQDFGNHRYGDVVEVEVLPFRAALIKATSVQEKDRVAFSGIPYRIVNDRAGNDCEVTFLGKPGVTYEVRMEGCGKDFTSASLDGRSVRRLLKGKTVKVSFPGPKMTSRTDRKVTALKETTVPEDAEAFYYATCLAADNNALEVRSLKRSGETSIPQVKAARDAFFNQKMFIDREIWDRNIFDGDPSTAFSVNLRWGDPRPDGGSSFMLDLGHVQSLDSLTIESFDEWSITPLKSAEGITGWASADLKEWKPVLFRAGKRMTVDLAGIESLRYFRFSPCPLRVTEVTGHLDGKTADRSEWRASNLFGEWNGASQAWAGEFTLDEIHDNAYLCIAVNGIHGQENVWGALKIDDEYHGCPDRAPSFKSNVWEFRSGNSDRNYTFYYPLSKDTAGKRIEAVVLYTGDGHVDLAPEIRVASYPLAFKEMELKMHRPGATLIKKQGEQGKEETGAF